MSVTRYVTGESRRESRDPYRTDPNLTGPTASLVAEFPIMALGYVRRGQGRRDDDAAREMVSVKRRCESCGQFVSSRHLKTARYYYAIDFSLPVSVYSLATATVFQERLDCATCSMRCCRMTESERDFGTAVGWSLPGGWVKCSPEATQADFCEVSA